MSKVSNKVLAQAIMLLSDSTSQDKLSKQLAAYLVQERRSDKLDVIMREVATLREKTDGIVEADIISAFPANKKDIKEAMGILGIDKYVANEIIDEEMVGGVRVEANGRALDLTVRSRLNQLKGDN